MISIEASTEDGLHAAVMIMIRELLAQLCPAEDLRVLDQYGGLVRVSRLAMRTRADGYFLFDALLRVPFIWYEDNSLSLRALIALADATGHRAQIDGLIHALGAYHMAITPSPTLAA